jgi:16S rRNA G966 N2-methylase RsmD
VVALGVKGPTRVVRGDAGRALDRLAADGERFELVFLDPPYGAGLVDKTLGRLGAGTVTTADAIVIAQHFTKQPPPDTIGTLAAYRARRFGETTLTFFRAGAYDAQVPGGV